MSKAPKRTGVISALTTLLLLLLALSFAGGCSRDTVGEAADSGGMGMGGDSAGWQPGGVIAEACNATFTAVPVQASPRGVVVESVTAPADGWLLVRSLGASAAVLGAKWVPAGTSHDVVIPLTAAAAAQARVVLHVDRGTKGELEFDPASPLFQRDAPLYADDRAVQAPIQLSSFGAEVAANSALVMVEDQKLNSRHLVVRYLLVPAASWVSVNESNDGAIGRCVGKVQRPAGEWQEVQVPLGGRVGTGEYVVTVHQDSGRVGEFEFDPTHPLAPRDAPYRAAGVVVSQGVTVW